MKILLLSSLVLGLLHFCAADCSTPSATTVSGTNAPTGKICSGDLIFEDNFDELSLKTWDHEVTMGGGGNYEFQWYTNSRTNSYAENGFLFIKPTYVADESGEGFLSTAHVDINGDVPTEQCTNSLWNGCIRDGTLSSIINPIKSARIRTVNSFNFKYGKVEVRAKLPAGDWLWPAIWMLPRWYEYSGWPMSGEIDIMESRGNRDYVTDSGVNIGTQVVGSTLHWGPDWSVNGFMATHAEKSNPNGYNSDFHNYQLFWDQNSIQFSIDDEVIGRFEPPAGGFWEWGNFESTGLPNPWRTSKSKLAPFDKEFYLIINLAVGGLNYFPDEIINQGGKPWSNSDSAEAARTNFWNGRQQWYSTWKVDTDEPALQVDYVRVWAL